MTNRSFRTRAIAPLAMLLIAGTAASARTIAERPAPRQATLKARINAGSASNYRALGGSLVSNYGAFSVVTIPADQINKLTGAEILFDENIVQLNAGGLDTTTPAVKALQVPRGEFDGKAMHLIQFAGPIKPEWYNQLVGTRVQVIDAVPSNGYLVYGDSDQIAALQQLAAQPFVQWDGQFQDSYRINPAAARVIRDRPAALDQYFEVQLVVDPAANEETTALIAKLGTSPVKSDWNILHYRNITAQVPPALIPLIAARPDVISIYPYVEPTLNDERQDMIVSGNLSGNVPVLGTGYLAWLASKGFNQAQFTASGFAVDVTDSGIDNGTTSPNHFGLWVNGTLGGTSRIIYNRLVGTAHSPTTNQGCDGHGNLNTHIVCGFNTAAPGLPHTDAAGYHFGLGVAPFVKAGSSVIFDPSTYTNPSIPTLQTMAYADGARVSTNSWGAAVFGAYNTSSQAYDICVRDAQATVGGNQEMVIVFSAGNSGPGGTTIGSPGTGKNVFTIGAAENVQAFGGADNCGIADSGADSANDIIDFSSRGPCVDGRKKPDLMAPGTHCSGGVAQQNPVATGTGAHLACYNGSGVCRGFGSLYFPNAGQEFYTASSGTSHSCPCVAGGCALVRQYFINNGLAPATPAMTKAFLMNSARYMTGVGANDTLYSNNQGMGEMQLGDAFDRIGGTPTLLRDEVAGDIVTATGQTRTYTGSVATGTKPFRVTLAWTDHQGGTASAAPLNNLDLSVTVNGNTYLGNVFTGANSVTGGSADALDNVESVFLPAGTTGPVTITVTAANIVSDGVPGVGGALDQDFALVGYNFTVGGVATGACCVPSTLTCQVLTLGQCTTAGGTYAGNNVTCATANCPSPGACCLPSLTCQQMTGPACTAAGGVYRGNNTLCAGSCQVLARNCSIPGTFTDISPTSATPGTLITNGDDSSVAFTSSVTNALVTTSSLFACTNGMITDVAFATFTNSALPAPGVGLGLFPNWDDLFADTTLTPPGAVLHRAAVENGHSVEIIEWYQMRTFFTQAGPPRGNFEVKIWGAGGPALVQYLYQGMAWDWNGNSSTVGFQRSASNFDQWSFGSTDAPASPPLPIPDNSVCSIVLTGSFCYANCDNSTTPPILNVNDFACFLNAYAAGQTYANCDNSTSPPVLNVNDFACFLNAYAAGCS